ncbi:MAG: amidohydrolase family protein [Dehalococcoidia bacterium]
MVLNDAWLDLAPEEAIEPDLPIVDPHHHLWDYPTSRYLLEEIVADTASHNVRQTVFIECSAMYRADGPDAMKSVGETEFVQGIAAMSACGRYGATRVATGIVGTADLMLGDAVVPVLQAQIAASPNRFRGIRHRAAWPDQRKPPVGQPAPAEHILRDATFRQGFRHLREHALSFEAWVYHPDIPDVADLARAFPGTTIILNHMGGPVLGGQFPGSNAEIFAKWKDDIAEVASCQNVVLKVGGIQMPVNGFGWHEREKPPSSDELVAVNAPWYLHGIEQFGPDRCMLESNFPVDRASCSYTALWNQFKKLTKGFASGHRAALFHDTAMRVYRLPHLDAQGARL